MRFLQLPIHMIKAGECLGDSLAARVFQRKETHEQQSMWSMWRILLTNSRYASCPCNLDVVLKVYTSMLAF